MLDTIFATKVGMTQVWSKQGKRLAVTKCKVNDNLVVGRQSVAVADKLSKSIKKIPATLLEVGYGKKKLKNVPKSLKSRLEKSGFSSGVRQVRGVLLSEDQASEDKIPKIGDKISISQVIEVGDMVKVQGVSKGRGFAGAMKRHNFHGGPKTHGQSDRARAVGSIGAGTYPGRVWKGKKMPGHYGVDNKTVMGLTIVHIDQEANEVWISGPVPGFISSTVSITKLGEKKNIQLDKVASGIKEVVKIEAEVKEDNKNEEVSEEKK